MIDSARISTTAPTAAEVDRGTCIDFEGRIDHRPALLGVYDRCAGADSAVRQVVLTTTLERAAAATGLEMGDIERLIAELVSQAETEGRTLIGWSSREIEAVRDHCSTELAMRFEAVYRDAKKAAKSWRRACQLVLPSSTTARGHALSRYARLIGYQVDSSLWSRGTAKTIRTLEEAFAHGATFETLGRGRAAGRRKARWTMLRHHNELDCRATYQVARVATGAA